MLNKAEKQNHQKLARVKNPQTKRSINSYLIPKMTLVL